MNRTIGWFFPERLNFVLDATSSQSGRKWDKTNRDGGVRKPPPILPRCHTCFHHFLFVFFFQVTGTRRLHAFHPISQPEHHEIQPFHPGKEQPMENHCVWDSDRGGNQLRNNWETTGNNWGHGYLGVPTSKNWNFDASVLGEPRQPYWGSQNLFAL